MRRQTKTHTAYVDQARAYAEERLNGRLLEHTRGCAETARKLALRFGLDEGKAAAASYLHDVAKPFSLREQAALAKKLGMSTAEIGSYPSAVLHGPLAARMARRELEIDDPEILQAIEAHSTGCTGMSDVAKVVFIADYIELTRSFPGASELRSHGDVTLDQLTRAIVRRKLEHLFEEGKVIDPRAIELWNDLMNAG